MYAARGSSLTSFFSFLFFPISHSLLFFFHTFFLFFLFLLFGSFSSSSLLFSLVLSLSLLFFFSRTLSLCFLFLSFSLSLSLSLSLSFSLSLSLRYRITSVATPLLRVSLSLFYYSCVPPLLLLCSSYSASSALSSLPLLRGNLLLQRVSRSKLQFKKEKKNSIFMPATFLDEHV